MTGSRASPPTPRSPATICNTEVVLYQDPQDANAEHHGGAIVFGNDGKLYFTTGDHFQGSPSQDLTSPRGKIHRINPDGTVPTDNPFYDGNGPNVDSIWALGLRNPYRAYYDAPTGRLYVGDVGGNDAATAKEEVNLGGRGRQLRLAELRRPVRQPLQRARSIGIRTTGATLRSRVASSTTGRSFRAATRAAISSPTTRRTGSSG